ncbi:hypothetical protein CYLTODRAFT_421375 [Cylindrobasidium torrendii FP15055 ss-10]|uniref:Uncharacterized protein n=1 Tax=Cylindrobasidium torrendii FP15055 ss-10 TaxID=1314674 RepID=A0A0D7BF43_9AGAR|nr:hypothetical protein CYLTODRAFT_421375 [Cylindrobasidium torrendii FP15055 ss-10]
MSLELESAFSSASSSATGSPLVSTFSQVDLNGPPTLNPHFGESPACPKNLKFIVQPIACRRRPIKPVALSEDDLGYDAGLEDSPSTAKQFTSRAYTRKRFPSGRYRQASVARVSSKERTLNQGIGLGLGLSFDANRDRIISIDPARPPKPRLRPTTMDASPSPLLLTPYTVNSGIVDDHYMSVSLDTKDLTLSPPSSTVLPEISDNSATTRANICNAPSPCIGASPLSIFPQYSRIVSPGCLQWRPSPPSPSVCFSPARSRFSPHCRFPGHRSSWRRSSANWFPSSPQSDIISILGSSVVHA